MLAFGDVGEDLARVLFQHPQLIPFYLLGLWFLVLKPLFDDGGKKPSEPDGGAEGDQATKSDVDRSKR